MIEDYLDRVAQRSPTPGGGSVAALVGSLGCALARMVGEYSATGVTEKNQTSDWVTARETLHRADSLFRALITKDIEAYTALRAAGKQAKSDTAGRAAYQDAIVSAAAVPLELAAIAAEALECLDERKDTANPHLTSDLAAAAVILDAAARAAYYLVYVNARELSDEKLRRKLESDIEQVLARCNEHRAHIVQSMAVQLSIKKPACR